MKSRAKKSANIRWFADLTIADVPVAGGKNAALGELRRDLVPLGINVPDGFAVTADAFRLFLRTAGLDREIKRILAGLDTGNIKDLQARGRAVREAILKAEFPDEMAREIAAAYRALEAACGKNVDVAVRSSATAEDLPDSSFAGQQETYLHIVGEREVLAAAKRCMASLFTDRAISYRHDKGFLQTEAALSVGVQKMVRSDLASSGVMFTLDPDTGFDRVVVINGSWGLGEMIVQGKVSPDEWMVFKPALAKGFRSVIEQNLGDKNAKMVYAGAGIRKVATSAGERGTFCLSEKEVLKLAAWGVSIEEHFSKKRKTYSPMDIEWAKDGASGEMYIVQARPETVHSQGSRASYCEYRLREKGKILASGSAVGMKIASGAANIIQNPSQIDRFRKGEVLVTEITDPDWEPIMKLAAAIVTDKGGRTSHAAIVSRELGIPCIVGTGNGTRAIPPGRTVTADCSSGETGTVYDGALSFTTYEHRLDKIPKTRTKVMVNVGSPDDAFSNWRLPAAGVGLGRLEFIIASHIRVHPNLLLDYQKIKRERSRDAAGIVRRVDALTRGYTDKTRYYVDELAEGIAKIAAVFYPHDVIIRFSDFKTNEYRTLLGGERYEPHEENPMIGWRGASRYHDPKSAAAFGLECRAVKKVREEMGLVNVVPMVPFCRTPEEGRKVVEEMARRGLSRRAPRGGKGAKIPVPPLRIYVMCEIPSNVIRADEFLDIFDGMSVGSNDLTQLTLGLDRDSGIVAHLGDENDAAVKRLIADVIAVCKKRKKYIGICGQAPSDHPGFAEFLVDRGIDSISLNPDTVLSTILRIAREEKKRRKS